MDKGAGTAKVYSARTLDEAVSIERMHDGFSLKFLLMCAAVKGYVFLGNLLITALRWMLFPGRCRNPKSIIVYTVGTLGDNILMLPAVAAIRRRYLDARLTLVTNCDGCGTYSATQVWGTSEYVDRFVALAGHPVQRRGFRLKIDKTGLEGASCVIFVNLSPFGNRGLIGAALRELIFARSLKAKEAIGFWLNSYSRGGSLKRVQHYFVKNEARRPREVLKQLGITPLENIDLLPHDGRAMENVETLLSERGIDHRAAPLIVLNPGSKLPAGRWPAERFGVLAAWLRDACGASVVVNGTASEKEICERVAESSGGAAINLAGNLSLQELIELLRFSTACVSNNTGTMTLAAMIGIPHVVLSSTRFSPTFYMPLSNSMAWLFSFSANSYSYVDGEEISGDLLNIGVDDVKCAVARIMPRHVEASFAANFP